MSRCVYTGAQVHFVDYGYIAAGDIYQCGDCFIIRWNSDGDKDKYWYVRSEQDEASATHQVYLCNDFGNWHNEKIGVTVVTAASIKGEMR